MTQVPVPANPPPPGPTGGPRPNRWATRRRRSVWAIFSIAGVLLVLRIALIFIFPAVLEHVLAYYHLTAGYREIKLDVLGGDAEIWGLTVRPIQGGPNVMHIEYCHGNISIMNLFRGRLYVRRAVADGADLFVRRKANGDCPLLDALLSSSQHQAAAQAVHHPGSTSISLAAPLHMEAFRLEHLRMHLIDHSVAPVVRLVMTMNVRVSHLGRRHGATRFHLDLWSPSVVDVLHIGGSVTTKADSLLAQCHLLMRGLRLQPTSGYLAALNFKPGKAGLSLHAQSTLALQVIHPKAAAQTLVAMFTLQHLQLNSGGRHAFGLDSLVAHGQLARHLADVQSLAISGLTIHAGRGKNGLFHFAGLEVLRRIATAGATLVHAAAPQRASLHAATSSSPQPGRHTRPYQYAIDQLSIHGFKVVFDDQGIEPNAHLQLNLGTLQAVSTGGLPGTAGETLKISGSGALPGIASAVNISGTMRPFARTRTLKLQLAASDITTDALAPYLATMGIKSELKSASFNADFSAAATSSPDGTTAASFHLDHLTYRDGRNTLCDFKRIDIDRARLNAATGRLEIGSCNIVGPAFDFSRQASGAYTVLGMQILGSRALRTALPPETPAKTPNPAPGGIAATQPPRLQINHFHWSGIRIGFDDHHAQPATRIGISHAGLLLNDFILDLSSKTAPRRPGTFKAWLQAPGLIHLSASGTVGSGKNSLATSMQMHGTDINLLPLTPYLKPLGILPWLTQGALTSSLGAKMALHRGRLVGSVWLSHLDLRQAGQQLAAVQEFHISSISAARHDLAVQQVRIVKPFLQVTRLASGNLSFCGIDLLPARAPAATAALAHAHLSPGPITPLRAAISDISLSHALVRWIDLEPAQPLDVRLHITAVATNAILGHRQPPMGSVQATLSAKGLAEAIHIGGSFAVPASALIAHLHLQATHLQAHVVNTYLPAGVAFAPQGQDIAALLDIRLQHGADGSISGQAGINNLRVTATTGAAPARPLLIAPHLAVNFQRINLARHRLAINVIDAHIKTLHLAHRGSFWSVCGLHIGGNLNAKPPARVVAAPPHTFSILHAQLPLLTLQHLQWRIDNLVLAGLLPHQKAVDITALDLHNTAPIRCLGSAPAREPAVALRLSGSVKRIAGHVVLDFHLKPFANHPRATAHMTITGIRGPGLAEAVPALGRYFAMQALKTGELTADASVSLRLDRRSPLDFNLAQPFSASAALSGIAFRDTSHGPVVVGLDRISADKITVDPARSSIAVPLLNMRKLTLRLTHNATGWNVAGLPLSSPKTPPPALSHVQRPRLHPAPQPAKARPWLVLIKRTVISGIDARYVDHTCIPPVEIPLTGLEAQIFNLGTTPLTSHIPLRFNVISYAGSVSHPAIAVKKPSIATKPATRKAAPPPTKKARPLFAQFSSNGQLYLYPHLQGWARASLNGMDLAELAPLAKKYGVTLAGGTLDNSSDIRFHAHHRINVHTKLVFSNLNLSEPPHGALAKLLHLPTPLNIAIAAIEAPDGSITLPLSVPIRTGHISQSAVTGQILADLVQVVAVGIASSPLKIAGGLASLFASGKLQAVKEPPIKLHFTPGSTTISSRNWLAIKALAKRLRNHNSWQVVVRQQISSADIAVAARRANPTKSQCLQLITALGSRTHRLLIQRRELLGRLRGELAIRLSDTTIHRGTMRLSQLDAKLARAQMAINYLANMLAPGATREASRRTRGMMITIARRRLFQIKTALLAANFAHSRRRVHIVFPQYVPTKSDRGGPAVLTLVRTK